LVRGNTISEEIYQINFRYDGEMKVESPKEEVTEAPKEEPKKEAPKEEPKKESKKEAPKKEPKEKKA